MKSVNEISNDFYCSSGDDGYGYCGVKDECCFSDCLNRHRKHPTPEQFKEEYGEAYPKDGAVYYKRHNDTHWAVGVWDTVRKFNHVDYITICACTPFGKPADDWRPE
jgi:hypothetical protein